MLQRGLLLILLLLGQLGYTQCNYTANDFNIIITQVGNTNTYSITVVNITNQLSSLGNVVLGFGDTEPDYTAASQSLNTYSFTVNHDYDPCEDYVITCDFDITCGPDQTQTINLTKNLNTGGTTVYNTLTPVVGSCGVVSFSSSINSGSNLNWNFGDGNTSSAGSSTSHTYSANGTYNVILSNPNDPNSCTEIQQVTISDLPSGGISVQSNCSDNFVTFTSSVDPAFTHNWTFGDGNTSQQVNPTHTYAASGAYLVTLTVTDPLGVSCGGTFSQTIYNNNTSTISYNTLNPVISSCGVVTFTSTINSGTNLQWNFGDGTYATAGSSTTHTYSSNGTYTVTLNDPNNPNFCIEYQLVTITGTTTGSILADTDCSSNVVDFISVANPSFTRIWDFGDGTTSTVDNPTKTYNAPGQYLVTLTVSDPLSILCSGTFTKLVTVGPPVVNFSAPNICENEPFTPQNVPNGALSYNWDFGDMSSNSNVQYPVHNYTVSSGTNETFTVALTIITAEECTTTVTNDIVVSTIPSASIIATPEPCNNLSYSFIPVAFDVTSLAWNIEGVTIPGVNNQSLQHSFNTTSLQTIELEAINGACSILETTQLIINDPPTVSISGNTSICEGSSSALQASIVNGNGPFTYSWLSQGLEVGTNSFLNVSNPGEYILKVFEDGCTNYYSASVQVTVAQTPIISDYIITNVDCPGASTGSVELTIDNMPSTGYKVNGGATQTASPFILSNLNEGYHYVTVSNAINASCSDVAQINIVYDGPTLTLTPTTVDCSNGTILASLSNNTTSATITSGSIQWFNANDPNTVLNTDLNLNPLSTGPGIYFASVEITPPVYEGGAGCILTSEPVQMQSPTIFISFTNTSVCQSGGQTDVTASATLSNDPSATFTYTWQNANGTTVGTSNVETLSSGTYLVTALANNGCSFAQEVVVEPTNPMVLTMGSTPIGCGDYDENGDLVDFVYGSVFVSASGGSGQFQYDWEEGGVSISNYTPEVLELTTPGVVYDVEVIDNETGCVLTDQITSVMATTISNVVAPSPPNDCDITVTVNGGIGPFTYDWILQLPDATTQLISTTDNPSSNNLAPGNYVVKVTDAYGCTESSSSFAISEPTSSHGLTFKFAFGQTVEEEEEDIDIDLAVEFSYAGDHLLNKLSDCIIEQKETVTANFKEACLTKENFSDELNISYALEQQQYTLFYYDRAGNLTKTVPPEGVDFFSGSKVAAIKNFRSGNGAAPSNSYPDHRLVTEYDYNSLGELIVQKTPDGGVSKFIYDDLKRLRFSQSARQKAINAYSYTKYDALGRMIEAGESQESGLDFNTLTASNNLLLSMDANFPYTGTEIVKTIYSNASSATYYGQGQTYIQNRVSHVIKDEDGDLSTLNDQYKTHYSYDVHGNVKWLIQEDPTIGENYISYEYDLISGNVKEVKYNENRPDKYFHRYNYDSDNRLVNVETSRDGILWDQDASYEYYYHGPLKREEIGEDSIQGTDYAYTIQGWLKGINNAKNTAAFDPGHDGSTSSHFLKDVFGMTLGYFKDDFKRTGNLFEKSNAYAGGDHTNIATHDLYNGNISSWASRTNTNNPDLPLESETNISTYTYDNLNRIKSSKYYTNTSSTDVIYTPSTNTKFQTDYTFDRNGNLHTLKRHNQGGTISDNLEYFYTNPNASDPGGSAGLNNAKQSNQLVSVTENASSMVSGELYGNKSYVYDASGNLIQETGKEIINTVENDVTINIAWTVTGKIKTIDKSLTPTGTSTVKNQRITFHYDAMDNRIGKTFISDLDNNPELNTVITRYVLDASGNVMAVYEVDIIDGDDNNSTTDQIAQLSLKERPIYGSQRIGLETEEITLQSWAFETGDDLPIINYNEDGTSTITELSEWIMSAIDHSQTLGDGTNQSTFCQCEILQTAFADNSPHTINVTDPNVLSDTYYGKIKNGLAVGENTDKEVELYAVVVEDYLGKAVVGNTVESLNQCLVLNSDGELVKGTEDISQVFKGTKPILSQVVGQNNYFRLFTVDENRQLQSHVINTEAQGWGAVGEEKAEVETINTVLNTDFQYGQHMAVIEDHINERSILYTSRYIPQTGDYCIGTTEIVAYEFDGIPNSIPVETIIASLESGDKFGQGEIQISRDGNMLVYYNRKNEISGFAHQVVEINALELSGDKLSVANTEVITRNYHAEPNLDLAAHYGTYGKASVDFTTDNSLYFGQNGIFEENSLNPTDVTVMDGSEKQVHYYNVTDGTLAFTMVPGENQYSEVRRGKDLYYYVPTEEAANTLNSLEQGVIAPNFNYALAPTNYSLLSSLPSQPHKILNVDNQTQNLCRLVGTKHYEFKDHLGNVRAVVSDRRGFEDITAGVVSNEPELIAWTDYYPYGSPMPTRSFSSNEYRYGFNGMEKDDEVSGEGNTYTTMFRAYDARIGRWKSLDPVTHPWQSPYNAFDGNPIYFTDASGADADPPDHKKAMMFFQEHLEATTGNKGALVHNVKDDSYTITNTVDFGDLQFKITTVFTASMTKSELKSVLASRGVGLEHSYEYYNWSLNAQWSLYGLGMWLDNWYLKTPPAPVEMISRLVMAVPGTIYGWSTGKDWMTGEELSGWEQALGILDVIPGEALAKAGITALFIKVGNATVDVTTAGVKTVLKGMKQGTIKSYKEWTKIKKGLGFGMEIQAHHIFEKAHLKRLGMNTDNAPAVLLSKIDHQQYTSKLAKLTKGKQLSKNQLLDIYRDVYKDNPDWIKAIEKYVNE